MIFAGEKRRFLDSRNLVPEIATILRAVDFNLWGG